MGENSLIIVILRLKKS